MGKVCIVGAGVIGLSCGIKLLEAGHQVTIVSKEFTPYTCSDVAAGFWMPFLCGPSEAFQRWCKESYHLLMKMCEDKSSGCRKVDIHFLMGDHLDIPWWSTIPPNFHVASADEKPPGYKHAAVFSSVLVESPIAMKWLVKKFISLGGRLEKMEVKCMNVLSRTTDADVVVNCTGLGSYHLMKDTKMKPIRGQVLLTDAPAVDRSKIWVDEEGPNQLAYIVPRDDGVLLGGSAEEGNWSTEPTEEMTQGILKRTRAVLGDRLRDVTIKRKLVGLRPGRTEPRFEIDTTIGATGGAAVIHNYGHGGSGWTVAWGCANDTVKMVDQILAKRRTKILTSRL